MIFNFYNIRDERQGTYGAPIVTDKNEEQVAHDYENTILNIQSNIARYQEFAPEKAAEVMLSASQLKDCVIYKAGTFDNKTGKVEMIEPVLVCRVSDFFREAAKNA